MNNSKLTTRVITFCTLLFMLCLTTFGNSEQLPIECENNLATLAPIIDSGAPSLLASFKGSLEGGHFFWALLLAMAAGFLTSLSPCVYPLIPITLSIIGSRNYQSHFHGFLTAGTYVLGMTLVYGILGIAFASFGILAGSIMQHPVVIMIIASTFLLMALIMFGFIDFVVPTRLMNRLSRVGGRGFKGAFLMGLVAGVIAAPCTGPVLGFILTIIAQQKNLLQGVLLMIAFSLGLGILFLVLGTFSSSIARLPKSGAWMNKVKYIFGTLMLGAAISYVALVWESLQKILEIIANFGLIPLVLFFLLGLFILLLPLEQKLSKKFFVSSILSAVFLSSFTLATILIWENFNSVEFDGKPLVWNVIDHESALSDFEQLLKDAKKNCQPIVLDFYADWCVACKQLDNKTYSDKRVQNAFENFVKIKIDESISSDLVSKIEARFGVKGLPTIYFIDGLGQPVKNSRIIGFIGAKKLLNHLKKVGLAKEN